jgi:hypothetical protein
VIAQAPRFDHLARMTDAYGTFEHAEYTIPRPEHGYCTDDMARVLVVTTREPHPAPLVSALAQTALRFVVDAQGVRGDCRNRRSSQGMWQGRRGVEDCWGRSLWGLGTAAARSPDDAVRQVALAHFERGAQQRSPWPRAMAFAALGADEILTAYPDHRGARDLLIDAVDVVGNRRPNSSWPWPESRLSYANAVLPDAMIAAGVALDRTSLVDDGLDLLGWLVESETCDGHLSVTPVGGRGPGDQRPEFDQQPIEVATLADACARASRNTGTDRWAVGVTDAVAWFLGDNDAGAPMWDPETGGGYDGLRADGPNLNQGAESTLALISTLQHGRRGIGVGA